MPHTRNRLLTVCLGLLLLAGALLGPALALIVAPGPALAQQPPGPRAVVSPPVAPRVVNRSLASLPPAPAGPGTAQAEDEGGPPQPFPGARTGVPDPARQPAGRAGARSSHTALTAPVRNFAGIGNTIAPPDTNGDVGPNHYVQMINFRIAIWDKQGTQLLAPTNVNQIWTANDTDPTTTTFCESNNRGDPVVVYDQLSDRWLISQFTGITGQTQFHQCIAISQTADPVNGGWFVYDFDIRDAANNAVQNDYPHFGVWPDAYYMSTFEGTNLGAFAFDRTNMLAGNAATYQYFSISALTGGRVTRLLPSDLSGPTVPPAGAPNYFVRGIDGDIHGGADRIELFEFDVDWANTANTTFTSVAQINTAGFDADLNCTPTVRDCLTQPGTTQLLDVLSNRLMRQAHYRNFGTREVLVLNQSVDVGDVAGHAGIRWYELRRVAGAWSIFQQSTFSPDAASRWMGGIAMDKEGNIALGYSIVRDDTANNANDLFPGIRYAGRHNTDALNTLQTEQTLFAGAGAQTDSNRWGDYSSMMVDPTDDCTFWYTQMYIDGANNRQTRIGSFAFPSCSDTDLRLTKTDSPDPVGAGADLTYTLTAFNDGGNAANEVRIVDTLPAGVTFQSASAGCTNAAGTVTCQVGLVPAGQNRQVTITVRPVANYLALHGTSISNTASVSSPVVDETVPANNSDTETTTVIEVADLALTKADSPDPVYAGTELTYIVTLTNNGPSDATNARFVDTLPAGVSLVSATAGCVQAPALTVTCTVGALAAGDSVQRTIVVLVDPLLVFLNDGNPVTLTNSATASNPGGTDPVAGNNTDSASTQAIGVADVAATTFDDPNRSANQETPEVGLPNVTLFIDLDGDGRIDLGEPVRLTGAGGKYTFKGLGVGVFRICEVAPSGRGPTSPRCTFEHVTIAGPDLIPLGFGLLLRPNGCGQGIVVNSIVSIDLDGGSEEYWRPIHLTRAATLGVWAGTRLRVQPHNGQPGNHPLTFVRPGEQVSNALLVTGINAAQHANLVLTYRHQRSYQEVVEVVAADGTQAGSMGGGPDLPLVLPTTFRTFDRDGQLYIFGVPQNGQGGYQDVYVVTRVQSSMSYITTRAEVAGKVVLVSGQTRLQPISQACGDDAASDGFTDSSTTTDIYGPALPVDDVADKPLNPNPY